MSDAMTPGTAPGAVPAADPAAAPVVERATADVVVIGGGVAGLVAALECAKVGLQVTVLERRDELGGCVGRIELDGLSLDSGAESFATRGGAVAELLGSLGLDADIENPNPAGAWLVMPGKQGLDAAPLPKTGMLGIPSNPLGDDVRRIIGWNGAIRAYVDRVKPILTIGRARSLGELVRSRMGQAVLDRLVTPISAGVYSSNPDDLDLDIVAPGLNEAMTRTGSLSGGVGQLLEERKAGTAVRGIRGGMHRLVDALEHELARFGVTIVRGAEVTGLERDGSAGAGSEAPGWVVTATTEAGELLVTAPDVVLAASGHAALALVDDALDGWTHTSGSDGGAWPPAASVELVTLVLDAPELDAAPRGTGVLVAADAPGVTAKALTHSTAKWSWLAEQAGGRHVVRLSYGRAGAANPLDGRTDAEVAELALADAALLLGVPLDERMLRASGRTVWRDAISQAAIGQRERVHALEDALAAEPGIEATGSWVAGTGLASVVPHALEAARRIRHRRVQPDGNA
ncbi:oxygen-dependent protoporphyrinogen oxidase [Agromyces hippuratus]|uniref:Coproporphyrinogen III oxidase n=1 Tax=Agromyces hippuratus TaxID=286438 RepID=A0A852X054_9MICO|nr:protoporphyrinogen oxidase [Agromyces hippuratus]NYG21870.1 oxygen-dependent protoporphyrinogen oxidase [Agromyces hippuratus]